MWLEKALNIMESLSSVLVQPIEQSKIEYIFCSPNLIF